MSTEDGKSSVGEDLSTQVGHWYAGDRMGLENAGYRIFRQSTA